MTVNITIIPEIKHGLAISERNLSLKQSVIYIIKKQKWCMTNINKLIPLNILSFIVIFENFLIYRIDERITANDITIKKAYPDLMTTKIGRK